MPSRSRTSGTAQIIAALGALAQRQLEHGMRQQCAGTAADHLHGAVGESSAYAQALPQSQCQANRRIEMRR